MKKVRAFFIVAILVMAMFVVAVMGAARSFAQAMDDGMMMPASSGLSQALNSGKEGEPITLIQVNSEDEIYSRFGRYYVGEGRSVVDVDYPMWISGGAGLRFLDDENWLISADVNVLRTFEGLYLTGGTTYNVDRTQADLEEFILLQLKNGLYMNAQTAQFVTKLDSYDIPANSVLMLGENALRWYSPDGNAMAFGQAEEVFDAVLRIGQHEYDYASLLKALGLIGSAIEKLEDGKDPSDELNQAQVILASQDNGGKGSGSSQSGQAEDLTQGGADSEDDGNNISSGYKPSISQNGAEGSGAAPELDSTGFGGPADEASGSGSGSASGGDSGPGGEGGSDHGGSEGGGETPEGPEQPSNPGQGGAAGDSDEEGEGGEAGPQEPGQPGDDNEPGQGGENSSEGGTGTGGSGSGQPVPYQAPEVELLNLNLWSYAVNMQLRIDDPSGTISKGVKITAYKELKGGEESAELVGTTEKGYPIFRADEGRSSLIRKSYTSSQTLNLSPVSPDTTLYLQYSYTYIAEETIEDPENEGQFIEVRVRKNYYSDFIKVTTPSIEDVPDVAASWEMLFAEHPEAIQVNDFTLTNTTDYSPEDTSFENFKKNMLPYVNRMVLQCTPVDGNGTAEGDPVEIVISSTVLSRAQAEGGTTFTSSTPKLESNQRYSVKAALWDRYSNELPLLINEEDSSRSFEVYTAKAIPQVEIIETANVTDRLTITLKVSDPDGALAKEEGEVLPLTFTAEDSNGQAPVLTGTFEDGSPLGGGQSLTLDNPEHGKTYTFTIDSLAFARTYQFWVTGSYAPQPDNVTDPSLQVQQQHNVEMGYTRIYTASLSSGLVNFSTSVANLADTSMTLNATMTSKTTLDILPLVDEYRISITKDGGKDPVISCVLSMEEMDRPTSEGEDDGSWYYDESLGALVLQKGDAVTPAIMLVADESLFATCTPWEALSPRIVNPDAEKIEYTTPARIRVDVPQVLETSTRYNIQIESVVIKSGEEYRIPTTLSTSSFTTKKIRPKLQYSDLFAAGDVISFIDAYVYDPDGTIQEDGLVYVYLYYNGTLLDMETIYAGRKENGEPQTISFDGITEGAEYELRFVAAAYNDSEGFANYETNYILWSYMVEGGSSLNGDINVESIEYTTTSQARNTVIQKTGEEVRALIESGEWTQYSSYYKEYYTTQKFEIPAGINFLQVESSYVVQENTTSGLYQIVPTFYDSEGKTVTHSSHGQDSYYGVGGDSICVVPEGAVTFTLRIPVTEEGVLRWGFKVYGYETDKENLLEGMTYEEGKNIDGNTGETINGDNNKVTGMIPVQPGQLYFWTSGDGYSAAYSLHLYTETGGYVGSMTSRKNLAFTIPEGVGYVRMVCGIKVNNYELFRVADAVQEEGYTVTATLEVTDSNGYLTVGLPADKSPTVTLELYMGDTLSATQWNLQRTLELPLKKTGEGNTYELDPEYATQILSGLPANRPYKLVLKADYQKNEVTLDSTTFQTDGAYFIIRNQRELQRVSQNPFANYLVVEDFEHSIGSTISDLYGTIDFQGHVITRSGIDGNLINNVRAGGTVRNLVYDFPANLEVKNAPIGNIFGTVENYIVRTQGRTTLYLNSSCLLAYAVEKGGVLRNFILELGGDLILQESAVGGGIRYNNGLVENGYMYGKNGAGVMLMKNYSGGFMGENYPTGTTRNVFTLYDSWFLNGAESTCGAVSYHTYYDYSYSYHVGDFYQYVSDKSTVSPMAQERVFYNSTATVKNHDVYYISLNSYAARTSWVRNSKPATLYDEAWQQSVLGDGFDTSTIQVGFYPRLNLSTEMQKYQNYLPLPVLGDGAPQILSDGWESEDGGQISNDGGRVSFILDNPRNSTITGFTAAGLKFDIQDQTPLGDGLYEVIAYVSVDGENPQYLSTYTITEMQYTAGSSNMTAEPNYKTSGFEFWKTVSNSSEWAAINDHMNWNYRLVSDIDFKVQPLAPAAIVLHGDKTGWSKKTNFTGKIDGDGHTISNIVLQNLPMSCVIYNMYSASEIRDLTVQGLTIETGGATTDSLVGFVRNVNNGSMVNVHLRDVSISGTGYVGALAGQVENGLIQECSVADAEIDDGNGAYPARIGGLIGYMYGYRVERSYTRNVDIQVISSPVVEGVGGMIGYTARVPFTNCYTQGTINATGGKVGGLVGFVSEGYGYTDHVWTNVDITATGDQVGGLAGRTYIRHNGAIVFGNILTRGQKVNRVNGEVSSSSVAGRNMNVYAYNGQTVNNLSAEDVSDATGLATAKDLTSKNFWADVAKMGSSFDYSQLTLEQPGLPLILREDGTLVDGQIPMELPGQVVPPTLRIIQAEYRPGPGFDFLLSGELQHPGYKSEDIIGLLQGASASGGITFDGIDISQASQIENKVKVDLDTSAVSDEITTFSIQIEEDETLFTKRLDVYTLTVAYQTDDDRSWSLNGTVDFGEPLYWEVDNITTWNDLMAGGHAETGENFLITGKVDFGGNTQYVGLKLGNLMGKGEGAGFYNLNYTPNSTTGTPWIENVYGDITEITFSDIVVDYSEVDVARGVSGAIVSVNDITDCTFENITILANQKTNTRLGFFGQINGNILNVTVDQLQLTVNESGGSYVGGLAGQIQGSFNNVTGEKITVNAKNASNVGGLFGAQIYVVTPGASSVILKDIEVTGSGGVGGLAYQVSALDSASIEDYRVTAVYNVGGLTSHAYYGDKENITARNGTVSSTNSTVGGYYTGGVFGSMGYSYTELNNVLVENVKVTGYNMVGGLAGEVQSRNMDNIQIIGCEVTNLSVMPSTSLAQEYYLSTGALAGINPSRDSRTIKNVTVRDTTVTGPHNVGGLIGMNYISSTSVNLQNIYIAEDVVVNCTGENAGGVLGRGYLFELSNVACGAQVHATGNVAGGIVGRLERDDSYADNVKLSNVYFSGSVYAGNYAGGIIGQFNDRSYQILPENLSGVLMTGSVQTAGDRASLWANSVVTYAPAGNGTVMIWEDSTLNGQTAKAIKEGQEVTTANTFLYPEKGGLASGNSFSQRQFYTDLGFEDAAWDLKALVNEGNQYMPFLLDGSGERLPYTDKYTYDPGSGSVKVGILLPEPGTEPAQVVLYASGVDSFTLDLVGFQSQDGSGAAIDVQLGDGAVGTYTTDANGSISFSTDFQTPVTVTVDDVPTAFTSEDMKALRRNVMTYDGFWYYLNENGNIIYDSDKVQTSQDDKILQGIASEDTPVHLWQGKILCRAEDGTWSVYKLQKVHSTEVVAVALGDVQVNEKLDVSQPLYSYNYTQNGQTTAVQVFHEYTLFGSQRVDVRLFNLGDNAYVVSPRQNVVADGMILSQVLSITGTYTDYYALLQEDGTLVDNRNNMKLDGLPLEEIAQISNNFGYDGNVAVIRYAGDDNNSNVVVVDYSNGNIIVDTRSAATALLSYARVSLAGIMNSFGTHVSDSFLESEASLGTGSGQAQAPEDLGGDGMGGEAQNQLEGDAVLGTGEPDGAENDPNGTGDEFDGIGDETDGIAQQPDEGDSAQTQGEYQYIPGQGLCLNGTPVADEGVYTYQPGEGLYKDGVLAYAQVGQPQGEEQAVAMAPAGAPTQGTVPADGTGAGQGSDLQALMAALGSHVVVYSEETGGYETVETAVLLGMKEETSVQEVSEQTQPEQSELSEQETAGNDFTVNDADFGQKLTASERSGFVLLGAISVAALAALIILYFRYTGRKHKGS